MSLPAPTRRAISPEMAAKLSAVATNAAAASSALPPPTAASAAPASDSSDAIKLTPYVVQEDRLPEFKEREILTPKGKLELARRRYPGLIGPFSDKAALAMLEEDFALERRKELGELQGLAELSGVKPSGQLKRQIDESAMRPSGLSIPFGEPFRPPK